MQDHNTIARNWRDLIRPKKLDVEGESLTESYGKFTCEPLERGYGITLGNSLRRVLLSSLQGSAITTVRIEGALHEFTTVPGVVEDVTDVILNIKALRLADGRRETRGPRDRQAGEGPVTAADIQAPTGVQVLDPNQHIATLSKGGRLHMEMTCAMGRGYFTADQNKTEGMPIGVIPIDSLFSPIRKVNYRVTNARVGHQTDYDRLIIEVWTDGSVKPDDAVAYAAKILKEQLSIFINREEIEEARSRARARLTSSTSTCGARSTNSSSRFARPTACRTPTSTTSATSCSARRPRCSRPRTLAVSRSRRSRRSSRRWACLSA